MPFIPILVVLAGVATLIGWNIGRGSRNPLRTNTMVGALGRTVGPGPGLVWNPYTSTWERARKSLATYHQAVNSAVRTLTQVITQGGYPPPELLDAAYNEASGQSDFATMRLIEQLASQGVAQPPFVGGEDDAAPPQSLAGYEAANPDQDPELAKQLSEPSPCPPCPPCPIGGLDPGNWAKFCEALHTRKPQWSTDRYLGMYEHSRQRLKQLGLAPTIGDPESQYQALCSDLSSYNRDCDRLLGQFTGDVVDVDDKLIPVTRSGILGLLKAAGPDGAESWLRNKRDRLKFPRTTEIFCRTNGCF